MPLFPGHPPFQVLNFRTPRGIRVAGAQPWGPVNDAGLGYMAEYVMATSHSGAHIDALAHMTVGDGHRTGTAAAAPDEHLTDFGPVYGDASKMPPFFTRGVLLDAPRFRGVDCLPKGSPIDAAEMEAICADQGVTVQPWDVVLIRTGYMGLWPDAEKMAAHKTAGPGHLAPPAGCSSAASWPPAPTPRPTRSSRRRTRDRRRNPQPVHTLLLIENGVYIMESLDLEELAQRPGLRVPVRRPAAEDPRRDRLHGRSARRHLEGR